MMNAVIYARYSSDNQREESIEGQVRECREYAEKNGIELGDQESAEQPDNSSESETEKNNEQNPEIVKLLEDPEVQEKLKAIKASEHMDNL